MKMGISEESLDRQLRRGFFVVGEIQQGVFERSVDVPVYVRGPVVRSSRRGPLTRRTLALTPMVLRVTGETLSLEVEDEACVDVYEVSSVVLSSDVRVLELHAYLPATLYVRSPQAIVGAVLVEDADSSRPTALIEEVSLCSMVKANGPYFGADRRLVP